MGRTRHQNRAITTTGGWSPHHLSARVLSEEWRRWRKHAGVTFHFHALRHYYASALIAAGQSPTVVQQRLGHGSISITFDTYGHLWPADEDATREAIEVIGNEVRRTADGLLAQRSRSQG